ncbi:putative F-box protein At3g24700 [Spinacia oleracea]|uniref:F-box protein At3g24700 n=1 Tax=Spinacia oleracea TaxID=3562 RepID=A0A9R0I7J7_SPIOL|nr:putative F-box protein At3g24700 [Spinacia oleracea]
MAAHLSDDLLSEILVRLPAKSLVRLRSTCKTWKSIITNPLFHKSHFHHCSSQKSPLIPSFLFFRSEGYIFSLNLDLNHKENTKNEVDRNFVSVTPPVEASLGSCNGLVCLHVINANVIIVWNPITNEYRDIESPINGYSICKSGFGFASSINDYKILLVVATRYYRRDSESIIYVYSFKKRKWRLLDFNVAVQGMGSSTTYAQINYEPWSNWRSITKIQEAVQLHEKFHWVVGPRCSNWGSITDYYILKFDLVKEIFERTSDMKGRITKHIKPKDMYTVKAFVGITRRNNLCVCQTIDSFWGDADVPTCVETWMLEGCDNDEGRESWKRLFKHRGDWRYMGDEHSLLKITGNARVMIMEKKNTNMEHMLVLDATQDTLKYVQVNNKYVAQHKRGDDIAYSITYLETLISPDSLFQLH